MFKVIYPIKDATVYSQYPDKNTGVDPLLEIGKWTFGSPSLEDDSTVYYDATHNSRTFLYFDLGQFPTTKMIGVVRYYLVLRAMSAENLAYDYTLYAYPLSGSWTNGTGLYNNSPTITNGVSWYYKDSKLQSGSWATSSYTAGTTGSYGVVRGGGNWYTTPICSQSFQSTTPDVRMDVTDIVNSWLSGSIQNSGIVLKFSDAAERDSSVMGLLQFFSRETNTIYIPRLEAYWDSTDNSGTGSFTQVSDEDFVLVTKNLRDAYSEGEVTKIKLHVRPRYPTLTYATSSNYLISNRIPTSSYFQIQDVVTDEVIVPFNTLGTKVGCNSDGNYITLDCDSLLPERYYKIVFKCLFDGGDTIRYVDDGHQFRITRI